MLVQGRARHNRKICPRLCWKVTAHGVGLLTDRQCFCRPSQRSVARQDTQVHYASLHHREIVALSLPDVASDTVIEDLICESNRLCFTLPFVLIARCCQRPAIGVVSRLRFLCTRGVGS